MLKLRRMSRMNSKTKKIVVILLASLVVLFLAAYLGRGWIRGTALPSYANHVYGPRASRALDENYPAIRSKLAESGIQLPATSASNSPALCDKLTNDESTLTFHGIHETIGCNRMINGNATPATDAFISHWQQEAPALTNYLRANGYQRDNAGYNSTSDLADIFNAGASGEDAIISYTKQAKQATCVLQIYSQSYDYTSRSAVPSHRAYADYQCIATLEIFGGYNYWAR